MNPLKLLEDPLRGILDFLHENCHLTYGWSIVALTVLVRLAMLPLVVKQYASMRSMQMVAPQLKELQRKYKGNRQKLQEETMAFYKQNEINPFASCLPLVAQIPIFIALYYVLKNFAKDATVSGGSLSFMWLVNDVRVDFTSIGWGIYVLLVIYALSQLLSTELSFTPNMPENQKRLMRFLPLLVVFFVYQFPVPAGLVLYWMTTNLWTAGQQLVMRHRIGLHLADPEELAKFNANQAKSGSRTAPREDDEDDEDEVVPASTRKPPRKRRGGGDAETAEEGVALEASDADGVTDAPEATEAPDARDAPEPADVPEPAVAKAPKGANGSSGNQRRQPRPKPKGVAKGSRPAGNSRSKKKKR